MTKITESQLIQISDAISKLSSGRKDAILSVAGLYGSMTPEARKISINTDNEYTLAIALVIQDLSQRLLANFYFRIKKVNYPVKIFKSEEEATSWLYQQIHTSQQTG